MLTLRSIDSFSAWLSEGESVLVTGEGTVEVDPVGVVAVAAMCSEAGMPASFVDEAGVHDLSDLFERYVQLAVATDMAARR